MANTVIQFFMTPDDEVAFFPLPGALLSWRCTPRRVLED